MLNADEAHQIACEYLRSLQDTTGIPLVIVKTREEHFGWVYFYQSKSYVESEDFSAMLTGNAPFIVDRVTSEVHVLGTAHPVDFYIEEYERQRIVRPHQS